MFFKSLALIGVSPEQLKTISNDDVVRIEKKLIAEYKLNNSLSKNDIDRIIYILKNYPAEINAICNYEGLYSILAGENSKYEDYRRFLFPKEERRIKELISVHLKEDLISYIEQNFKNKNWRSLIVLSEYKILFEPDIEQLFLNRLESKLKEAVADFNPSPSLSLRKRMNYLRESDFYELLNRIDAVYFKDYLYEFLNLVEKHLHKTDGTIYFHKILKAMLFYAPSDRVFQYRLDYVSSKVGNPLLYQWLMFISVFAIPVIFVLMIIGFLGNDRRMDKTKRVNPVAKLNQGPSKEEEYLIAEQHLNMQNFIEARKFAVQDSDALKLQLPFQPIKYGNPFQLDLFRFDLESIKNPGKHMNIFNETERECVVLAYFDPIPSTDWPANEPEIPRIYALYIPKKDSIQIDLKMSHLRFYMGKNLRNFNNYRGYVYPDSNDYKFSEFIKKDSILFGYKFWITGKDSVLGKQQNLVISEPGPEQYKFTWTGKSGINCVLRELDGFNYIVELKRTKPLLFPDSAKSASK
ncbi:hypothetical protein [Pedobacter gandavensis]|uniref:hypothetical protein n=1 Tax=Pedobacter gandavensis TaxID=2679963 RepID=UPI00292F8538|nr:hypothetical protein [Pedobacter gandavensis]